ncbi:Rieske (2Fe-2S) protein [Amycolatopsis sp. NPDC059657]|uniref:Rieske (2Fe-2S) protein n=1 Tax=Amycolatopsis sp. NPDC059657 TaxID=3346899 RepID=UPI0036727F0D
MTAELPTRRTVLSTGATVAGMAALAACGSGSDTKTPAGGNPSAPAASGSQLATLADIPVGQAIAAKTPDGQQVIVARPTETTAAAFSAICTHQGCSVAPSGSELKCPCHGSLFDALTGAVKKGPADQPLPAVQVKVDGGKVVTA